MDQATLIVEWLEEEARHLEGYGGPGWYWVDPEFLAGRIREKAVTGPYATRDLAVEDYWAYCSVMVG